MISDQQLTEDAHAIQQKRIFKLFELHEIVDVLKQLDRLRTQNPGYRDDELLMFELLAVTKLKGAN